MNNVMSSSVDVGIYVDQQVYDQHGYDPAYVMESLLRDALNYNNVCIQDINVESDHGFDVGYMKTQLGRSPDPCDEILPNFDQYLKDNNLKSAHEDHHLIYHHQDSRGGCAWPRVSVGHGDKLANLSTYDPARYSPMNRSSSPATGDAAFVSMQEVGHAMGLCDGSDHNCGIHYDDSYAVSGDPTLPGDSNDGYSTPLGASDGGWNQCGTYSKDHSSFDVEYCDAYYWSKCAGQQLRDKHGNC